MNLSTKGISMKNNHGNIFLFLSLFLSVFLQADVLQNRYCSYTIKSSKTTNIKLHEPISISFYARQKLHNEMMFFDFKAKASDAYEIVSVKEKRHEYNYHDAEKRFQFLLIPKQTGTITVDFDFSIRRASDDAVAQAYVGSRDNVKSIPTIKVNIAQPIITLDVQKLNDNADAVGNFTLNMKLDKKKSNSYDAINVVYTLEGKGFLHKNFQPLNTIEGISIFKGVKQNEPKATLEGYIYHKEWSYALVAEKDFTIPSVSLKYYDFKKQTYHTLKTMKEDIKIHKLKIKNLLDDIETPSQENNYKQYIDYIYNLLLFIAGFIVAKLLNLVPKKSKKKHSCCEKVQKSKTPKELLNNSLGFSRKVHLEVEIAELENIVYKKTSSKEFLEIKRAIVKKIKSNTNLN